MMILMKKTNRRFVVGKDDMLNVGRIARLQVAVAYLSWHDV